MKNHYRGGRDFERDGSRRRDMHQATCAECGNTCEVPFRPTGDRPIFCSKCFENKGGNDTRRSERNDFRGARSNFGDKKMFEAVCDSCGNECQVPFRPTSGKPVYCNNCFGKGDQRGSRNAGNTTNKNDNQLKKELEMVHAKLDAILKALSPDKIPAVKSDQKEIAPQEPKSKKTSKISKKKSGKSKK